MSNIMLFIFLVLLNYFWLSMDPAESASWYCDQHCFKIGSEVVESAWDVVLVLAPAIGARADELGIGKANRWRRHSKPGSLWHPLSVWNGLCRANLYRSLVNADAIFAEHRRRTGKSHSAWRECRLIMDMIDQVDFCSDAWQTFCQEQSGRSDRLRSDVKTLARRRVWWSTHATIDGVDVSQLDRRTCPMTCPPQCISEDDPRFAACRVPGDVVTAYRKYYHAKTSTISGGMRYLHTSPPEWLRAPLRTAKGRREYVLDNEGYVIFTMVDGKLVPVVRDVK